MKCQCHNWEKRVFMNDRKLEARKNWITVTIRPERIARKKNRRSVLSAIFTHLHVDIEFVIAVIGTTRLLAIAFVLHLPFFSVPSLNEDLFSILLLHYKNCFIALYNPNCWYRCSIYPVWVLWHTLQKPCCKFSYIRSFVSYANSISMDINTHKYTYSHTTNAHRNSMRCDCLFIKYGFIQLEG